VSGASAVVYRLRTHLAPLFLLVACSTFLTSCTSPPETAREHTARPLSLSAKKISLPAGWSVVSSAKNSVRSEIHLARTGNDASMIVKELKPVASAKTSLGEEDLCVLGNISMQSKLGREGAACRILRLPTSVGNGKPSCVYIYSENSLLRRVVVFRTKSSIYEVELLQNIETLSFSTVVDAQSTIVKSLMGGE
jgi:hypothetical protein